MGTIDSKERAGYEIGDEIVCPGRIKDSDEIKEGLFLIGKNVTLLKKVTQEGSI